MLQFLWNNQTSLSVTWADPLLWTHCSVTPAVLNRVKQFITFFFTVKLFHPALFYHKKNYFDFLKSALIFFCKSCVSKSAHPFLSSPPEQMICGVLGWIWEEQKLMGIQETSFSVFDIWHKWKLQVLLVRVLILQVLDRFQLIKM